MGAEEQRQVVGIEIMRKKPQGVGQRKGNLERTGQRVKARGHRVMGSRGWMDGLRETQGTKPAQKLDGLRHMEIELRGESQTQRPRGPRESSWTWPQEREAEVEVGMRPASSRAPAYSGLRPGQRKWRRAGGGGGQWFLASGLGHGTQPPVGSSSLAVLGREGESKLGPPPASTLHTLAIPKRLRPCPSLTISHHQGILTLPYLTD